MATENDKLPLPSLVNKYCITATNIVEIAVQKFKSSGFGITCINVMEQFHVTKRHAQRTLKYFRDIKALFTANDLLSQGIYLIQNKNPQQYFPSCIKAEIIEKLKNRRRLLTTDSNTTRLSENNSLVKELEYRKAQAILDVLCLLPYTPPYIHKLQLLVTISKTSYNELMQLQNYDGRKRSHEEVIGRRHVEYLFSANGTIEIFVTSNQSPFKIETDEDESLFFAFLGQVRDRLLYHVGDIRESYIPSLMDWILVQCDLNKDMEIDDKAQITLPDTQLRQADRIFRQYVKIIKGKAFCRAEESLKLNEVLPEALDNIRYPFKSIERLERKIDDLIRNFEQSRSQKVEPPKPNRKNETSTKEQHDIPASVVSKHFNEDYNNSDEVDSR
jgi:hypothetical protein